MYEACKCTPMPFVLQWSGAYDVAVSVISADSDNGSLYTNICDFNTLFQPSWALEQWLRIIMFLYLWFQYFISANFEL